MRPLETASGLAAVLRGVVADMQHVDLLARDAWTSYAIGTRPAFDAAAKQTASAPRGNTR